MTLRKGFFYSLSEIQPLREDRVTGRGFAGIPQGPKKEEGVRLRTDAFVVWGCEVAGVTC